MSVWLYQSFADVSQITLNNRNENDHLFTHVIPNSYEFLSPVEHK